MNLSWGTNPSLGSNDAPTWSAHSLQNAWMRPSTLPSPTGALVKKQDALLAQSASATSEGRKVNWGERLHVHIGICRILPKTQEA